MADAEPGPQDAAKADGAKAGAACAQPPKKPRKARSSKAKGGAGAKAAKAGGSGSAPPAGMDAKPESKADAKPEPTPEPKPEAKADAPKADAKPEPKPEPKPDAEAGAPGAESDKDKADVPATVDDEPEPKTYTPEEIEAIAAKVETYRNQTPEYSPSNMLSPEFEGTSNYERGLADFRTQKLEELERMGRDPEATDAEIAQAKDGIRILDHLYENYHQGMNVFRTAKGGRSKLRV